MIKVSVSYEGCWIPTKFGPDGNARGWKPALGWYCALVTGGYLSADLAQRFNTKRECRNECIRRNALNGKDSAK